MKASSVSFLVSIYILKLNLERYWQVVSNRRNFFITLAQAKGFDPLVAENWYSISEKTMLEFKVCTKI